MCRLSPAPSALLVSPVSLTGVKVNLWDYKGLKNMLKRLNVAHCILYPTTKQPLKEAQAPNDPNRSQRLESSHKTKDDDLGLCFSVWGITWTHTSIVGLGKDYRE